MSLAAPSAITVSRLYRVVTGGASGEGSLFPPSRFEVRGRIEWVNAETDPHEVEVVVTGSRVNNRYVLPKGATNFDSDRMSEVPLGVWISPEIAPKEVTIAVRLVSGSSASSAATLTESVDAFEPPAAGGQATQTVDSGVVTFALPSWTGVVAAQRFEYVRDKWALAAPPGDEFFSPRITTPPPMVVPFVATGGVVSETNYAVPQVLPRSSWSFDATTRDLVVRWSLLVNRPRPFLFASPSWQVAPGVELWAYVFDSAPALQFSTLFLSDFSGATFTVQNRVVQLVRGRLARIPLTASHPASWVIDSGAPAQFGLETEIIDTPRGPQPQTWLVGTPVATGGATVALTATRLSDDETASATVNLTVIAEGSGGLPKTAVIVNPGWLNNGLSYTVGETIAVALTAVPGAASWTATGLPPGLSIGDDGVLRGAAQTSGRYLAAFVATAPGYAPSDPAILTLTIRDRVSVPGVPGSVSPAPSAPDLPGAAAAARIPWVMTRWELIDLQVHARSRIVESSLMEPAGVRVKVGDDLNLGVFYLNKTGVPFALGPTALQFKVRPASNLEDSLVLASATDPAPLGGPVLAAFGEITIEAGGTDVPTQVSIAGATSEATRAGGGEGEADLVFAGAQAGYPWTFAFRGGEGDNDFVPGELVTISKHEDATWALTGTFRIVALDPQDDVSDPWVVLARPDPDPYYLLTANTGARQRERVLEWAEEDGKNEPLQCVGELEWVAGSKTYSSRAFPVLLDLDVVRAG